MSRFLFALVLGFSALAASSQAQAQPDRYLFVPDRSACCQDLSSESFAVLCRSFNPSFSHKWFEGRDISM